VVANRDNKTKPDGRLECAFLALPKLPPRTRTPQTVAHLIAQSLPTSWKSPHSPDIERIPATVSKTVIRR